MISKYSNILGHWRTYIALTFLIILPSGTQDSLEGHTLLINPEEHLHLLFLKYQRNNSICDRGLDKLISNLRSPKGQVGYFLLLLLFKPLINWFFAFQKCFEANKIVNQSITLETFRKILPTLVYDLVVHDCLANRVDRAHDHHFELLPRQNWRGEEIISANYSSGLSYLPIYLINSMKFSNATVSDNLLRLINF